MNQTRRHIKVIFTIALLFSFFHSHVSFAEIEGCTNNIDGICSYPDESQVIRQVTYTSLIYRPPLRDEVYSVNQSFDQAYQDYPNHLSSFTDQNSDRYATVCYDSDDKNGKAISSELSQTGNTAGRVDLDYQGAQ